MVDAYLETRAPVGSTLLAKRLGMRLSSATIRSVMADLEHAALLTSPHTSAGRIPTETGLRFVAQHFLELRGLPEKDQKTLEESTTAQHASMHAMLEDATQRLAGLSACAGVITAPQEADMGLRHVEFVPLQPGRALVVLVYASGNIENRFIELPTAVLPFHLETASNYLNSWLKNKKLGEATDVLRQSLETDKTQIDALSSKLIRMGVDLLSQGTSVKDVTVAPTQILVRGHANLVQHVEGAEELKILEELLQALDQKEALLQLLGMVEKAESVQLFIGADNVLFASSHCSAVLAPYKGEDGQVLGAVGVVGPSYMNYRRIVPMVDYTAHALQRYLTQQRKNHKHGKTNA